MGWLDGNDGPSLYYYSIVLKSKWKGSHPVQPPGRQTIQVHGLWPEHLECISNTLPVVTTNRMTIIEVTFFFVELCPPWVPPPPPSHGNYPFIHACMLMVPLTLSIFLFHAVRLIFFAKMAQWWQNQVILPYEITIVYYCLCNAVPLDWVRVTITKFETMIINSEDFLEFPCKSAPLKITHYTVPELSSIWLSGGCLIMIDVCGGLDLELEALTNVLRITTLIIDNMSVWKPI